MIYDIIDFHDIGITRFEYRRGKQRAWCVYAPTLNKIVINVKYPHRQIICTLDEYNDFEGNMDDFVMRKIGTDL